MYNNILVIFFSYLYSIVKDSNFHFQGHQKKSKLEMLWQYEAVFFMIVYES